MLEHVFPECPCRLLYPFQCLSGFYNDQSQRKRGQFLNATNFNIVDMEWSGAVNDVIMGLKFQ